MTGIPERRDVPGDTRPRVAVIGAGVSGLTAAYLLRRIARVTLFEADDRLGGHAHTHTLPGPDGAELGVDSGFIVHNTRTYPTLLRLFAELGVATRDTEMSMSISCRQCGLEYAGGKGMAGILARPARVADPRFLRLLAEVPRFHRRARSLLAADPDGPGPTWGEFLRQGRFGRYFVGHFAEPLVSCVWSSGPADTMNYPARHLFAFLSNHGMLSIGGSPTWRTVVGGSARYVEAVVRELPDVRAGTPVTEVRRHLDGVSVRAASGAVEEFDQVVLATHADVALRMLADATADERRDLAAIRYSRNECWLHRDERTLPRAVRARASWNYSRASCSSTGAGGVHVTYWMNRLQGLPGQTPHLVTLQPDGRVDSETVVAKMFYEHPIFTHEAVAAAASLRSAGGPRLAFAGAHLGWGFHEDGCRSGAQAAARFGGGW